MTANNDRPKWFDEERHVHRDNGIYEVGTGLFLAGDGLPYAGGARLARLVAAGAKTDPLGLVDDDMIAGQARHVAEVAKAERAAEKAAAAAAKALPASDGAAAADAVKEG